MDLERLRKAHGIVYGPPAITILPLPIREPHLIFEFSHAPVRIVDEPLRVRLQVRNVGEETCKIVRVVAKVEGAEIIKSPNGMVLPGQMALDEAPTLEAELNPFSLSKTVGVAIWEFQVQPIQGGTPQTFPCRLPYEHERSEGPILVVNQTSLVFDRVSVENLHTFEIAALRTQEVILCIEDGPDKREQYPLRYPMRSSEPGKFKLSLPLTDGLHYAYRFCLDGKFRCDERLSDQETVPGVDRPCTPLDYRSQTVQRLLVRNMGLVDLSLGAGAKPDWITVHPPSQQLSAGASGEVRVSIRPENLIAGEHSGEVVLRANLADPTKQIKRIPVHVAIDAPGPIPALSQLSYDLGVAYFGSATEKFIGIGNLGTGELVGRLTVDDPNIVGGDFRVPAGSVSAKVSLMVQPRGTPPEKSENHKARAYIETNTPVFGKEKLQFLLQYRVETMRFTPPKLAFGTISPGEEKQLVVEAIQGDASPITGEMRLKDRLEWVEVKGDGHGRIEILLNGTRLADQGDRRVPTELHLQHVETGIVGTLPFEGRFAIPRARAAKLDFGRIRADEKKTLPLPLFNDSPGTLIIKEILLDQPWLSIQRSAGNALSSLQVIIDFSEVRPQRFGVHEGIVEVFTNDPVQPKVEIHVKVRLTS